MNTADGVAPDQDTVVYWLWRNLAYRKRMAIAFGLIILGLLLQWYSGEVFAGVIPLIAGNALLLVRGYDNRVEFKGYDPSEQWQQVERSRLIDLKSLDKKMKRWDRSFIDITNALGVVSFVFLVIVIALLFLFASSRAEYAWLLPIPVDAAILFLPHWFTGTRRILRMPGLLIKAETLDRVLKQLRPEQDGDEVDVLMLLKGKEKTLPQDIKIKIAPEDAPEGFLGLYGQVVINPVQGRSYPYFYVVMVARPGLGLKDLADHFSAPEGTVAEYRTKDGVEILVLRQLTTKTSGYHTDEEMVRALLKLGLALMHKLLAAK
jgi:hypothetical protein